MAILVQAGGIQRLARRGGAIVLALTVSACASTARHQTPEPSQPAAPIAVSPPVPPRPANGLWAILDPGCSKPDRADTRRWPRCASPFWISHESAVIVGSRPGPKGSAPLASARVDLWLSTGDPLIVQVGTVRDGYVFIALDDLDHDKGGLLVGAIGTAFACHAVTGGPISLKPINGGCESASKGEIQRAAAETLHDRTGLSRIAWVAAGAP